MRKHGSCSIQNAFKPKMLQAPHFPNMPDVCVGDIDSLKQLISCSSAKRPSFGLCTPVPWSSCDYFALGIGRRGAQQFAYMVALKQRVCRYTVSGALFSEAVNLL